MFPPDPRFGARPISSGEIVLWLMDPATAGAAWIERHRVLLAPAEARRAESIASALVRHEYLCTRIMQRLALSDCADVDPAAWRFVAVEGGRPMIGRPSDQADLRFSLSHTRGLIAMALRHDADVGVDVEALGPATDIEGVARRFFAPEETEAILRLASDRRRVRFFQHWTLKEACLKALGTGLATPLDAFRFQFSEDGAQETVTVSAPRGVVNHWHVETLRPSPDHVLGLAVPSPGTVPLPIRQQWLLPTSIFRE